MAVVDRQGWGASEQQEALGELVALGPELVVDSAALERRQSVPLTNVLQLEKPMSRISRVIFAARLWRGDLMNLGETLFGEEAAQIVDSEHLTEAEAQLEKLVAARVKPTTRLHGQSWDHLLAVVKLDDEKQRDWLDRSRAEGWTPRKLSTEIAAASAEPGKTAMRFWLVIECGTQARMEKLAEKLTADGYTVKRQEKLSKVKVVKRQKKEPVTAKKKRSGERPRNQRPKKA